MKKFRKIYVEITNICNMKCSFCPETKRARAFMQVKQFERVVNQIKEYTDYVYLHVKGEPLLHPNLEEILEICEENNLKVNISTNGTMLKDKYELLKSIRQINISLHSFEKQDIDKLHQYLQDVFCAADYLNNCGVIVRYKLWNDNTVNNNITIINELENKYNTKIQSTTYDKDVKLAESTFLSIRTPFKWPELVGKNNKEGTCYGLRTQIAILVDGTVVPCCVDNDGEINLGNIFETILQEILDTPKAKKIKESFENNKCAHELCKKCEYRTYVT